jgi:hypothetical protein
MNGASAPPVAVRAMTQAMRGAFVSPAFRTARAQKVRGEADMRRHRQLSVARLPRLRMAVKSKCGAMALLCAAAPEFGSREKRRNSIRCLV